MNPEKIYLRMVENPRNVDFHDFTRVVEAFGYFLERTSGSHRLYRHPQTRDKLNLQPAGKSAKAYQVRQFIQEVEAYNLTLAKDES